MLNAIVCFSKGMVRQGEGARRSRVLTVLLPVEILYTVACVVVVAEGLFLLLFVECRVIVPEAASNLVNYRTRREVSTP
jgi:hypothetical protein